MAAQESNPEPPGSIDEFLELGRMGCIAHRGFSGRFPENTVAAFAAACELGVDMIELDVTLSADDELVVIHDETLERTTDGGGPVRALSWGQLKTLDAGSWFAPEFAGERIPALKTVLELARGRVLVNVEIKEEVVTEDPREGIVAAVIELVRSLDMGESVILSSFDPRAMLQARSIDPGIRRSSLFDARRHRGLGPTQIMDEVGAVSFSPSLGQVTEAQVDEVHAGGRAISVYTVNEPEDMQRMLRLGVDGIFTDHPDRLQHLAQQPLP